MNQMMSNNIFKQHFLVQVSPEIQQDPWGYAPPPPDPYKLTLTNVPAPLIFGKSCCAFFPEYMTEEAFIMAKICKINFWIGNAPPPPPFGTFPKIHPFWKSRPSLNKLNVLLR